MELRDALSVLGRRWLPLVAILAVIVIGSVLVAADGYRHRPYQGSLQVFVWARSPASGISGNRSLESEAGFMAQDLASVLMSRSAASFVSHQPAVRAAGPSTADIQTAVRSSVSGRTVTVTVMESSAAKTRAVVLAERLAVEQRARFVGPVEAARSGARVIGISAPVRSSARSLVLALLVRLVLGLAIAIAVALAWDYLDDAVHDASEFERELGAPVLATIRSAP